MTLRSQPRSGEGSVIGGRYSLQKKIGEGGRGIVWRALDRVGDRPVAIKEFRPIGRESEQRTIHERIRREALATQRLAGHPNIGAILDVLWEDDRPWIVMEYVRGEPLQAVIEREGRISPPRAARIGAQVLDALRAAHSIGILHRDVKPSNVLIDQDGVAKLTDFGIARLQGDPSLTTPGAVVGSPGYIAPERLAGIPESEASDLWSLGATLYAAVEGRMPYQRSSAMATMNAVLTEPIPEAPNAGPLSRLLVGLLDRAPANRLSAAEAASILERAAGGAPDDDRPVIEGLEIGWPISTTVWWARDRNREVRAVKVLPRWEEIPEIARSLAERPVDGMVRIHAVGTSLDGRPYILMDYADRGSLDRRTGRDLDELVRLGVAVARTVAAVNEGGVHFTRLLAEKVLFASTDSGDEEILLLPELSPVGEARDG